MSQPQRWVLLLVLASGCFATALRADEPSKEDVEFFEKSVRPLLVENCFECHSTKEQKANLRLDSREMVLKGGDSGPAVDPGNPDGSLLMEAVNYQGDTQMPPKGKLPDEKIAVLKDWIQRGAPWPAEKPKAPSSPKEAFDLAARKAKQWAFQPIEAVDPPEVRDTAWAATPVDRFLLSRLEAAGLSPAPAADKRTLLRRVTFDLIGLPPAPEETAAFLADPSPQAFERVVDRLLESPHYGERWGRHWLDLVRFAETRGHEFDFEIPHAFEYRDYVIRALNADVPYNQFVIEHVAGDLLPEPRRDPREGTNESIIGTGFFFLGESKHSPVDILGDEAERIDNQIDVFGKTLLACTLGCARCHDHKFDAISQKDYYALAGYLQSSRYHVASIDAPEGRRKVAGDLNVLHGTLQEAVSAAVQHECREGRVSEYLQAALSGIGPTAVDARAIAESRKLDPARVAAWVERLGAAEGDPGDPLHSWARLRSTSADPDRLTPEALREWAKQSALRLENLVSEGTVVYADFRDGTWGDWFVEGEAFGAKPLSAPWSAVESALTIRKPTPSAGAAHSGALSRRLQGALRSPTFTIDRPFIAYRTAGIDCRVRLVLENLQLIQYPIYGGLEIKLADGGALKWVSQNVEKWLGHKAYIEILDEGDGYAILDQVVFARQPVSALPTPGAESAFDPEKTRSLKELADRFAQSLTPPREDLPNGLAAAVLPSSLLSVEAVAQADEALPGLAGQIRYGRKAVVMVDGSSRDESVFLRGNPRKLGEVVPRRMLEAACGPQPPAPVSGSGRLELAKRLVDPSNPLTARVIVNRVWKHHFGEGLVRTPDDFGNMGQPPSHPELLDFLAAEFVRDGWSLKRLHRRLLLTRAWQMSSQPADQRAEEGDPQNRLWHRMSLQRLEAESLRDAMLAVSGRLNRAQYGPSVLPHLTPFMIGRGRPGQTGPLDGDGRRSVYINVRRNFLTPLFLAFDYPIPFSTIGRRSVSNVPAQALALMNNPFVVQQAGVWATLVLASAGSPDDRIRGMYEAAFTRPPTGEELQAARKFLAEQSRQYGHADDARSWTDLAHVLFNVKEFVFVN